MWKITLLNCLAPKLRVRERLDAHSRNWFTDGYRTSTPGTTTCQSDTDCEGYEICQSGYCAGIPRQFDNYGTFIGGEYQQFLDLERNPYPSSYGVLNQSATPYETFHRHNFQNDYSYA
jgi:hypothetical protein